MYMVLNAVLVNAPLTVVSAIYFRFFLKRFGRAKAAWNDEVHVYAIESYKVIMTEKAGSDGH